MTVTSAHAITTRFREQWQPNLPGRNWRVKKAATIHDGSVYAEQLQAVFAETFKKLGGTITAQEAVSPTDTDMRPMLTKIATGKPEFIYYPIFIAAGGHITRQVKEVKGLEKVESDGC